MKIYLFDTETGMYLGEDFADEAPVGLGDYVVPHDATTIPPPMIQHGQRLVFNASAQQWEVRTESEDNYLAPR